MTKSHLLGVHCVSACIASNQLGLATACFIEVGSVLATNSFGLRFPALDLVTMV